MRSFTKVPICITASADKVDDFRAPSAKTGLQGTKKEAGSWPRSPFEHGYGKGGHGNVLLHEACSFVLSYELGIGAYLQSAGIPVKSNAGYALSAVYSVCTSSAVKYFASLALQ